MEKTRAKLRPADEKADAAAPVPGKASIPAGPDWTGAVQVTDAAGNIDPKHHPKRHPPGSLKKGDSVWYRGERYWIEYAPSTWVKGCYARISDKPVHPDPARIGPTSQALTGVKTGHTSFCVHPDLLDLAPQAKNIYAAQPTHAAIARTERAAKGERDVGDDVAVKLRACGSIDEVYRAGADFLGVAESELRAKYGHLNPGQQRMNIGNRMRAKWKKDHGKA